MNAVWRAIPIGPVILICLGSMARAETPVTEKALEETPRIAKKSSPAFVSTQEHGYRVEGYLRSSATDVNASDVVDEMIDEVAADIARLGITQVSPILIDRIQLSENLAPGFAEIFEARLTSALQRATQVSISRCLECQATRGRIENGAWVLTRGVSRLDELKQFAANYGAKTVLSVALSMQDEARGLALDVQLLKPENASVVYSEGYRFSPETTLLYRGADRAQYREQRMKELQNQIDGRPYFGYGLQMGVLYIPVKPTGGERDLVRGFAGGVKFYEKFGDDRQYSAGFNVGGFINDTKLAGAMLSIGSAWRLTRENAYRPAVSVGFQTGAFITGTAGNSYYGMLTAEARFIHRIGFQLNVMYLNVFDMKKFGVVGGWSPGGGLVVSW